jgi:hypothetical protein
MSRALPLFLLAACSTPAPSAPYGTAASAQQSYDEAIDKCQQAHSRHMSANSGQSVSSDEVSLNACLEQAKSLQQQQLQRQ